MHGLYIESSRSKTHQNECIGIGGINEPPPAGNIQIGMKKMNIYGEKIDDEKMVNPTDFQGCFCGRHIEDEQYIHIEKRAQKTNHKKKKVNLSFSAS